MRFLFGLLFALALAVPSGAQENPPGAGPLHGDVGEECLVAVGREDMESALSLCRAALVRGMEEPRVMAAAARAELSAGDPARAVEIFRGLEKEHGWRWEWALGLARALWRDGRPDEAEEVLEDAVKQDPSPASYGELVAFLLSYSRWPEAAKLARDAVERFPGDCTLHEDLGVAEAGMEHDPEAAREIGEAIRLGCPPLRWTRRGMIPDRIERPEYRHLLDPGVLSGDLAALPEGDALSRLRLLGLVLGPAQAPALAKAAIESGSAPVKLMALHLLLRLGDVAAPQWRKILATGDIMLRKYALRMLSREASTGLLPVLEEHLGSEPAPHNLSLTKVAVARLLLEKGKSGRAVEMLREIPEDDPSFPLAREILEKTGEGE